MDLGDFWFLYGSPAFAVIICALNIIEILLLIKRLKRENTDYNKHRTSLVFLLNLAISDLCVGITVVLVKILYYLKKYHIICLYTGVTGIVYGVLLYFFLRFSMTISILNLIALLIDRLLSIRNPFRFTTVQIRYIIITIAIIWALLIAFVTGFYYFSVHVLSSGMSILYRCIIFPVTIIPAIVVFSFCYIFIFKAIHAQGRQFRKKIHPEISDKWRKTPSEMHPLRRESKLSRFVGCVIFTFVLCWFPLAVVGIVRAKGIIPSPAVENPLFILAFCNSAINSLIYFGFKNRLKTRRVGTRRFVQPVRHVRDR